MSIKVMSQVWALPVEFDYRTADGTAEVFKVTAARRLILLALADHANDEGICWPSQHGLAKKCGVSRASVNDCLKMASRAGLLRIFHRKNARGLQTVSRYTLTLPQMPAPVGVKSLDSTGVKSTPASCLIQAPVGVKSLDREPSVHTKQSSSRQPPPPGAEVGEPEPSGERGQQDDGTALPDEAHWADTLTEARGAFEPALVTEALRQMAEELPSKITDRSAYLWAICNRLKDECADMAQQNGSTAPPSDEVERQDSVLEALADLRRHCDVDLVDRFVHDEGGLDNLGTDVRERFMDWQDDFGEMSAEGFREWREQENELAR